jgi:hypothetical protein
VNRVQALYGSIRRAAARCTGQARATIASTTRCNAPPPDYVRTMPKAHAAGYYQQEEEAMNDGCKR